MVCARQRQHASVTGLVGSPVVLSVVAILGDVVPVVAGEVYGAETTIYHMDCSSLLHVMDSSDVILRCCGGGRRESLCGLVCGPLDLLGSRDMWCWHDRGNMRVALSAVAVLGDVVPVVHGR